jgi:hypothetical protein
MDFCYFGMLPQRSIGLPFGLLGADSLQQQVWTVRFAVSRHLSTAESPNRKITVQPNRDLVASFAIWITQSRFGWHVSP